MTEGTIELVGLIVVDFSSMDITTILNFEYGEG